MRGVKITGQPPGDWLVEAQAVTVQLHTAEATPIGCAAYSLQLLENLARESELPKTGTSLVVVASVAGKIHARIFDAASTMIVDAAQPKRDHPSSHYNELAQRLKDNWDEAKLKPIEITEIFRIAETIGRRFLTSAIIEDNENLWRDDRVRNWLLGQFNNKCWYSEAQDSVSSIHVDHFRPKGRITDEQTKRVNDGYWWLAFVWTNYRIGGELLNVKKSDIFPFSDATRATHDDAVSLRKECPILLDPACDLEARLISYDWRDEEMCVAVPAGRISPEQKERAERTIDVLGLNRLPRLRYKRAEFWERCKMAIQDYVGATGPQCLALIEQANAKVKLREMIKYEAEFSSVAEACVRKTAPEPLVAAVFEN